MTHTSVPFSTDAQIHKAIEQHAHIQTCTHVPRCLAGRGLWGQCCVSLSVHLWNDLFFPSLFGHSSSIRSADVPLCFVILHVYLSGFPISAREPQHQPSCFTEFIALIQCSQEQQFLSNKSPFVTPYHFIQDQLLCSWLFTRSRISLQRVCLWFNS